jgi:hypothetical protein
MVKYYWMNQAAGHKIITLMDQDEITALGASLRLIDQRLLTPAKEEGTRRIWYQGWGSLILICLWNCVRET